MHYVYILKSLKTSEKYIGCSTNLKERLKQHNCGQSNYTSYTGTYVIVWYCVFSDKSKAFNFEKYLKGSSGHAFISKHF
jgi:predicted GIY-YIG superfamily endonuclease